MLDKNLQTLRRARGLTQEQTAAAVGVTRQALSKWESGESLPDLRNCAALARFYDVTVDDLLNYDPEAAGLPLPPRGKHSFGFALPPRQGVTQTKQRLRVLIFRHGGQNGKRGRSHAERAAVACFIEKNLYGMPAVETLHAHGVVAAPGIEDGRIAEAAGYAFRQRQKPGADKGGDVHARADEAGIPDVVFLGGRVAGHKIFLAQHRQQPVMRSPQRITSSRMFSTR